MANDYFDHKVEFSHDGDIIHGRHTAGLFHWSAEYDQAVQAVYIGGYDERNNREIDAAHTIGAGWDVITNSERADVLKVIINDPKNWRACG